MPHNRPPPEKLPLTPRQLRLIYPLTPQSPDRALANVAFAYCIWPWCIAEVALTTYLDTLQAVRHPIGRPLLGARGQR